MFTIKLEKRTKRAATLCVFLLSTLACGRSRPQPMVENAGPSKSSNLELNETRCDEKSCEAVNLSIDGPNGSSEVLGIAGEPIDWSFTASALNAPNRKVIMKLYGGPEECKKDWLGQDSNEVSCSFETKQSKKGAEITAIARDVTYCLNQFPEYEEACRDISKTIKGLDDTEVKFSWKVELSSTSSQNSDSTNGSLSPPRRLVPLALLSLITT